MGQFDCGSRDALEIGAVSGHIGRMQYGLTTEVMFTCPNCRMAYTAVQERRDVVNAKVFNCTECKTQVLAWLGDFHYYDRKPVSTVKFGKNAKIRRPPTETA